MRTIEQSQTHQGERVQAEQLFLRRYEEVTRLADRLDEYDVIDCGARVYQLIMDKNALYSAANKRKMPIEFLVQAETFEASKAADLMRSGKLSLLYTDDGLDPMTSPNPRPRRVSRDELLEYRMSWTPSGFVRIKHILQFTRNAAGGVHLDAHPEKFTGEWAILLRMQQQFEIEGVGFGVAPVRSIARVVLRGLAPLVTEVQIRLNIGAGR